MEYPETADILIRAAEPGDATAISALLGQIGTFEGTLQLPDMPVASRLEAYQRVDAQGCRLVALSAGEVIGFAGLHVQHPSLRRSHVRSLAIALSPQGQGRGIGKMLMTRALDWADNWSGVLRIELMVQADNDRAIALYRGLGFVEEGRHKGYALKGGCYIDSLSMARLHPNPPRINA
ncbi:MAG TPA: GNAT family N-acetyltransferase [Polaromonas sp.]|uniref:GNAT family N-acetyltransferase n=1 Tax=Polaromonas sp. TaxID=1869339 RepID=UPI002D510506|nr:GNAT family N-acetyltransferase [Polaromonas sp.]HYW57621.1 GNAT family N-acetyltransferase [Polaromonas sp.]